MDAILENNNIYLRKDRYIDKEWLIAIGVSNMKGYEPISFYLDVDMFKNLSVKFQMAEKTNECELHFLMRGNKWMGQPLKLRIHLINNIQYIDITNWIYEYSSMILFSAYLFI